MQQRGGFVMGLVAGLLVGLALALGVALYITKAPIPFINKVPQRTAEQDTAETERNKTWDPNAALAGKGARPRAAASAAAAATLPSSPAPSATPSPAMPAALPPASPGVAAPAEAAPPTQVTGRSPAKDPAAILSGGGAGAPALPPARPVADTFVYFVQAGAYTRGEDAEQQRARLAIVGQAAKITEREQAGRTVYRVRMGPFTTREEADALTSRLQEQGVESQIVRVEKT